MTWTERDELREVRQSYREFKQAVLTALGFEHPWDVTVVTEAQIIERIQKLREAAA